jgi:hypothetical protein
VHELAINPVIHAELSLNFDSVAALDAARRPTGSSVPAARLDTHAERTMLTAMSNAIHSLFRLHQARQLIQGFPPRA